MEFFIPSAMAQAQTGAPPGGSPFSMLFILGGFAIFMYLFMIRPQQKRQKEHKELVSSIAKGDEVILNSGLLGKVSKVDENYVVLEVANNTELRYQKIAVHAVLPKGTIKSI